MYDLDATKAKHAWSETLDRVRHDGERIILKRHGKPAAALVSVEDLALLEEIEQRMDAEQARKILAKAKPSDFSSWKKVRAKLGL
ncbi:MAG: type II toxin-antitoxin system Phd/YefM family antitoxin [Phycisphaerales bacterium]